LEKGTIMLKPVVGVLASLFALSPAAAFAQLNSAPAIAITTEDIKAVLDAAAAMKRTIPDNQIRVIDMGTYNLAVGIIHRGPVGGGSAPAAAAPVPAASQCGDQKPGVTGPGGLYHDATTEVYVVTSGGGTLITGGTIANGRRSAADSEVTTTLNGPSCSGTMVGYASREVKPGDVVIIPAGTPHGFSRITDHCTYLSVRPDPKKVLPAGYVNPVLKK
jgi:hypothetical protein